MTYAQSIGYSASSRSAWRRGLAHFRYVMASNPVTLLAFVLLTGMVLIAIIGPWLVPHDPLATLADKALKPPSREHWFGTDQLGRDVFSRVIVATRLDLAISVSAVAISFVCGATLGAVAGYWGGWLDKLSGRLLDTIMGGSVLGMILKNRMRRSEFPESRAACT